MLKTSKTKVTQWPLKSLKRNQKKPPDISEAKSKKLIGTACLFACAKNWSTPCNTDGMKFLSSQKMLLANWMFSF